MDGNKPVNDGDAGGTDQMNPKEPSQAELDADRAANPDTSKQVAVDDPQSNAG